MSHAAQISVQKRPQSVQCMLGFREFFLKEIQIYLLLKKLQTETRPQLEVCCKFGHIGGVTLGARDSKNGNLSRSFTKVMASTN